MQVWDQADAKQRGRLVAATFEAVEVETTPSREIAVVAIPRPGWKPFFARVGNQRVWNQRETSLELAKDATWKGKRLLPLVA